MELYGKTYGVYGYGSIGRQSARIARAFGMEVLVCTRTVRPEYAADGVAVSYTHLSVKASRLCQLPQRGSLLRVLDKGSIASPFGRGGSA